MKLSEMWHLAAKELKQGKYVFYNPETDSHCAIGALIHYMHGHECCSKAGRGGFPLDAIKDVTTKFCPSRQYITQANDALGWSFEDFAKKAEELGL